jgi:hypothetical protein
MIGPHLLGKRSVTGNAAVATADFQFILVSAVPPPLLP